MRFCILLKSTFIHSFIQGILIDFLLVQYQNLFFFLATRKKTTFIKVIEIINCQENWTFTTGVKFFFCFIFIHLTFDLMYDREVYLCVCVCVWCVSVWMGDRRFSFIHFNGKKSTIFFLFYFCQIKSWYNNIKKKNKKSFSRKTFRKKKHSRESNVFFFTGWLSLFLWWLFLFVIFYFGETNSITITTTTTRTNFFSVQFIDIFYYYYYYSMIDSSNIYI